ncbi:MAG: hypothetical protein ABIQ33_05020 [Caldimonas sp.]
MRIRALQEADRTRRSNVAQRSILRIGLDELQQALVADWRLTLLLAQTSQDPQAARAARGPSPLGSRLARHTAGGWENAAVPDDLGVIASFLNLSPSAVLKLMVEIDAD